MGFFSQKKDKELASSIDSNAPPAEQPAVEDVPADAIKPQTSPIEPEKSRRALLVGGSNNLNEIENIDMKLIQTVNKAEELDEKIDANTTKLLEEIGILHKELQNLKEMFQTLPKLTIQEFREIKKNDSTLYRELKQVMEKKANVTDADLVDAKILKIIKESGKVSSHDLLTQIQARKVCSKNTLYNHLDKLENMGLIVKERSGHMVLYTTTEAANQIGVQQNQNEEAPAETQEQETSRSTADDLAQQLQDTHQMTTEKQPEKVEQPAETQQ